MKQQINLTTDGKNLPEGYKLFVEPIALDCQSSLLLTVRNPDGIPSMSRMVTVYAESVGDDGELHLFVKFWTGRDADSMEVVSLGRLV